MLLSSFELQCAGRIILKSLLDPLALGGHPSLRTISGSLQPPVLSQLSKAWVGMPRSSVAA